MNVAIVLIALVSLVIIFLFVRRSKVPATRESAVPEPPVPAKKARKQVEHSEVVPSAQAADLSKLPDARISLYDGPLLVEHFPSKKSVLSVAFSPDGKTLAVVCRDRKLGVRLYNTQSGIGEHPVWRFTKLPIDLDHGRLCGWTPGSELFYVGTETSCDVLVFQVWAHEDVPKVQLLKNIPKVHNIPLTTLGMSIQGHILVTGAETEELVIRSLKGEALHVIRTKQLNSHMAAFNPHRHLLANAGFTPEIKIWEILLTANGAFSDVQHVMTLKGHTSGCLWVNWSPDGTHAVTCSKDASLKFWNVNVNYKQSQDPKCLFTISSPDPGHVFHLAAISPDASKVAATIEDTLLVYDNAGALLINVPRALAGKINAISWHPNSAWVLISCEDDTPKLFSCK